MSKRQATDLVPIGKRVKIEEILPLDVWSIIMRFPIAELFIPYLLLSKRYRECVYSLPLDVLASWVHERVVRNYTKYRFLEHIAPQLESPGITQLVCGSRVVIRSATLLKQLLKQHKISITNFKHTPEGLFLAYYDLAHVVKDNSGIDKRLSRVLSHIILGSLLSHSY